MASPRQHLGNLRAVYVSAMRKFSSAEAASVFAGEGAEDKLLCRFQRAVEPS